MPSNKVNAVLQHTKTKILQKYIDDVRRKLDDTLSFFEVHVNYKTAKY